MNRKNKIVTAFAVTGALAIGGAAGYAAAGTTSVGSNLTYTSILPTRICDTRSGFPSDGGCVTGAVAAQSNLTINPSVAGITGESAVVVNVIATSEQRGGDGTIYAAGTTPPVSTTVNWNAGQTASNLDIVSVGSNGQLTLHNDSAGTVQFVVDLKGYFGGSTPSSPPPTTTSPSASATTTTPAPTTTSPAPTTTSSTPTPPPGNPVPAGISGNWSLDKADEFNGTSVDRSLWAGWFNATGGNPVNSGEDQGYSGANVTEPGDGYLHLALSSTTGALVSSNPHDGVSGHTGYEFTGTAAVEARIFLPGTGSTVDNWPAFWTDGQSWPANGESDIVEGLGGSTACHSHTSANQNASGNCPNVGPGWHTFGEEWDATAQTVTYFYDGTQVGSAPFVNGNAPNYLILDNTSSSSTGGPTVRNQTMLVDYVRVWKPATASTTPPPTSTSASPTTPATSTPPSTGSNPSHVVVVMMENHNYSDIIGNTTSASYINSLASQGVLYSDDIGKSHPSLPNYLDLYSGSTQGQDGSDNCISSSANNIGEQLGSGNIKEFAESLGTGSPTSNSGEYACRHNPAAQFTDAASKAASVDFSAFPTTTAGFAALPKLSYVTPNLIDDMHDGTIAQGDTWLKTNIDAYSQWAKTNNSMLVVTWDENAGSDLTTPLPMFIVGQGVTAGTTVSAQVNHENLFRTLEDWTGVTPMGNVVAALPGLPVN